MYQQENIQSQQQTKKKVFSAQYKTDICENSGMWLVYNCSGIKMVCESHKNV